MNYWKVAYLGRNRLSAQGPNSDGFVKILTWASELGFSSAELWIQSGGHLSALLSEETAPLKQTCSDLGIMPDYLTCDFTASWFLGQPEDYLEKYFERISLFARGLGIRTIATVSPPLPETTATRSLVYPGAPPTDVKLLQGFAWDRAWNRYVDRVRVVAKILRRHSLNLAVEPRAREMLSSTDAVLRLMERVPAENLGGVIDTSHLRILREVPAVSVYKLGRRLFEFQASENDGITAYHWAPGQGEVDWEETFEALGRTGFKGAVCIDVTGINMEKEILDGKVYVEKLLKRVNLWSGGGRRLKVARA